MFISLIILIALTVYLVAKSDKCRCGGTLRWSGYGERYECDQCRKIYK